MSVSEVSALPGNGISGGYKGHDENIFRAMMAFTAIALYNAIELLVLIFLIFKKWGGLYFWMMLIASFSIIPYALGAWMTQVHLTEIKFLHVSLSTFGWMFMVTSQSLVLYSRLHLVTQSRTLLRCVLWLIIIDSVLLYPPTAVLTYGSQTAEKAHFLRGYDIMEKVQMTIFTVQEVIISAIYLWEVHKILKVVYEGKTRKLMWELASINITIILLDVAILTVEYLDYYQIETTLKGVVYSIKLKLEFGVLSKLVKIVTEKADPNRLGSTARINDDLGFHDSSTSTEEKDADLIPIASFSLSTWLNSPRRSSTKLASPSSGSKFSKGRSRFPSESGASKTSKNGPIQQPQSLGSPASTEIALPISNIDEEVGSDPTICSPDGADLAQVEQNPPFKRCSVEDMYPGRLG